MLIRLDNDLVVEHTFIMAIHENDTVKWSENNERTVIGRQCSVVLRDGKSWKVYRTLDELLDVIDEYLSSASQ